jgi:hypothetical protein
VLGQLSGAFGALNLLLPLVRSTYFCLNFSQSCHGSYVVMHLHLLTIKHTYALTQPGYHKHLETYLCRCIEQLRAKQGVFTALHVLRSLLQLHLDELGGKYVVGYIACLLNQDSSV